MLILHQNKINMQKEESRKTEPQSDNRELPTFLSSRRTFQGVAGLTGPGWNRQILDPNGTNDQFLFLLCWWWEVRLDLLMSLQTSQISCDLWASVSGITAAYPEWKSAGLCSDSSCDVTFSMQPHLLHSSLFPHHPTSVIVTTATNQK